ncbi:MAG: hypothetical protein KJ893_01480 [Candidatus Omnitrophica bacterium]|nr:hypothetical protein [Candidatus Omnitrophota bacterium]MBU4478804.1 hypothetical protein [Candidatus Omnitrophota bacterium]MCG2702875.1 hypothetical protein [Candidatus Omnitrophota bacterium]
MENIAVTDNRSSKDFRTLLIKNEKPAKNTVWLRFLRDNLSAGFTPLEKTPDEVGGGYPGDSKPPSSITVSPIKNNISNGIKGRSSLTGFTYIEVLMAIFVLAMGLIPLLSQFYIGFQGNKNAETISMATDLAADLMEEIKTCRFDENLYPGPAVSPASLGIDQGEVADLRSTFDDVDDYNQWQSAPPQSLDGTALANFALFTRRVAVDYITISGSGWVHSDLATNYKRVIVTVSHPKINDTTLETIFTYF